MSDLVGNQNIGFLTTGLICVLLQVLRCSNIAVVKVAEITELIHRALENDKVER